MLIWEKLVEADVQIQNLKKKMDRIPYILKGKCNNVSALSEDLLVKLELDHQKAKSMLHEEISQLQHTCKNLIYQIQ